MSAVSSSVSRVHRREQDQNVPPHPNLTIWKSLKGVAKDRPLGCISLCATNNSPNIRRNRTPLGQSNFLCSDDSTPQLQFSSAIQHGHSRITDCWEAHEASEMAATIERQANEAELQELSNLHPVSRISVSFLRESSPAKSCAAAEMSNVRASSLVQMWRELEAGAGLASRRAEQNNCNIFSITKTNRNTTHSKSFMAERSGVSESCNSTEEISTDWESEVTMNTSDASSSMTSDEFESAAQRLVDAEEGFLVSNSTQRYYTSYGSDVKELGPGSIPSHFNFSPTSNNVKSSCNQNLFLQPEQERQMELDELEDRHAISQFIQKNQNQYQGEAQQKELHVSLPRVEEESNLCHDAKWRDKSFLSHNRNGLEVVDTSTNLLGCEGNAVGDMDFDFVQHMKPADEALFLNSSLQEQKQSTRRHTMDDEWLERHSNNVELLKLLERRTVSEALASDFRQRMDRIMSSFLEKQRQETTEYRTAQDHMTEEDAEYYINDHEVNSGDSVASTSIHLPLPLGCHQYEESKREEYLPLEQLRSNEMQLIYELREDMVHLRQEMCMLNKSIQNCMEQQIKLHHFAVDKCTGSLETSYERHKLTRIGNCCICYEMPVDSLLYRCGHMCTCFKCAHELHWDSGRCPICQTPILDVVRAHYEPEKAFMM